jgi:hypothetical protein
MNEGLIKIFYSMKTNYFFKLLATLLLVFLVTNVTAKQITVTGPATDADLAAALEHADNGDEIVVSGFIMFASPVTVTKNVTFIGASEDPYEDGFDGGFGSKIFELNPDPIEGQKLVFKDLGFFGGYNTSDGGVGRILTGTNEFYNCVFVENESGARGGAFYIPSPAGDAVNVRFNRCTIEDNVAANQGGAIFTAGNNVNTSFDFCVIKANGTRLSGESRGGAFYINGGGTHTFYYTIIQSNTAGVEGEGGERGGGAIVTGGASAVTLESCAVWGNIAYGNHGSAFFVMGNPNITLINSVVAQNLTRAGAGSWFLATNDCDITFVNTIMTQNSGQNSGDGGGGIRVMNMNNRLNFFNSLVLGNDTGLAGNEGAVDIRANDVTGIESGWVFKNSIVGLISGIDPSRIPTPQDKAGINPSLINMYNIGGESAQPNWTDWDVSGVDFDDQPLFTTGFRMPYYTLKDANAYAAKLGDPALLADYDSNTDMFGVERTITGGAIFAGPVQSVTGDGLAIDPMTAIQQIAVPVVKENIRIIGVVSNGILGVDFGTIKGQAKGDLIALTGQVVETVFNRNVVGKGYYNVHVTPGIYLLRVVTDGNTYTQKLIVK